MLEVNVDDKQKLGADEELSCFISPDHQFSPMLKVLCMDTASGTAPVRQDV